MNSLTTNNQREHIGRLKDLLPPLKDGAEGIKKSLHGNLYQIKLTLHYGIYLWLQESNRKNFCLATEVAKGEKFDDLVVITRDETGKNKISIMFIQAKHSHNDEYKIRFEDLKKGRNANDNSFGLPKYFESYQIIKRDPDLSEYEIDKCYLCTNRDISGEIRKLTTEMSYGNSFFLQDNGELRKINPHAENITSIYVELQKANSFTALANSLAKNVASGTSLCHNSAIYSIYHVALMNEKIVKRNEKNLVFHEDFIDEKLTDNGIKFRNEFIKAYCREMNYVNSENVFDELRTKKLKTSEDFGKEFEKKSLPSDFDGENFALSLLKLIIDKEGCIKTSIKCNKKNFEIKDFKLIKLLAGHVFIYAEVKKLIKFRKSFFTDLFAINSDNETDKILLNFKKALEKEFKNINEGSKKLNFNDMEKCRFEINNYKTWFEKEPEMFLPLNVPVKMEEMNEFFEKFVFAINQPNESRLSEMIAENLKVKYNLFDVKMVTNYMIMKAMDWVKNNISTYLDGINIEEYFQEGKTELTKSGITAFTKHFRKQMDKYGNIHELVDLTKLWTTKRENVLWLCTTNPISIASMVVPTLMGIDENFKFDDSFIFISFSILQSSAECILPIFQNGKANLLVVFNEYDDDRMNERLLAGIGSDLLKIIEEKKDKKLVIISKESNKFYQCFKKKVREVLVEFESFTDLSKKIINFQSTKVSVMALMDGNDTFDNELKTAISSYKPIEIGEPLKKCKKLHIRYPKQAPGNEKVLYALVSNRKKASNMVSHLAAMKKAEIPNLWIVELKLRAAIQLYKKEPISCKDLLYKLLESTFSTNLERQMFRYLCDQRQIILIFDAVEKIRLSDGPDAVNLLEKIKIHTKETWIFITESFNNKLKKKKLLSHLSFKFVSSKKRNFFEKK